MSDDDKAAGDLAPRSWRNYHRGRRAGIDAWDLFIGNEARARAYASEELLEHWTTHPRVTVAAYERQVLDRHLYESGVAA